MNKSFYTSKSSVPRAVLYMRVSSARQMDTDADINPEGNSIDTQRKACQAKARHMGVVVVDEYIEPGHSAQTIKKRPVFQNMMRRILTDKDVDYVIVYTMSRAFRNTLDQLTTKAQLQELDVQLMSAKEDFGKGYVGDTMQTLWAVFNELEVKRNGDDIKTKMANKALNGGTIGRAKLGYLNARKIIDGRNVNTVMADDERAKYIAMAFQLFATGRETYDSVAMKLTQTGLVMPRTGKYPGGPISPNKVAALLRDRYYLGEVCYKGVWRKNGRHPALVEPELFARVQRVLEAHGFVRYRTHNHYLKGLLWCARCKNRLVVHKARGRHGGEFYYFFCRGRQKKICDLPFFPIEVMEKAVVKHYARAVQVPQQLQDDLRRSIDATVAENFQLTDTMRAEFAKRLEALDKRENYYLDLAAEEGWPKDKLRDKINAIRAESQDLRLHLAQAEQKLDRGKQTFYCALDLMENPEAMRVMQNPP